MNELELQQSPPQLSRDILYVIAEKLLALIPEERKIDFRQRNCYTNFMFLNEMTAWTIISQFAKFKKINFSKNFGGKEEIKFYRNNFNDQEFGGPYIVPKGMLEYIIENGKLRVNTISTFNFLLDHHSNDNEELGEMNSLKAFCALFLGKQIQIPDGLNNNLVVEKFQLDEPSIQNNFETILAINAVKLRLDISNINNILIDCSQYKRPIIANNTTKITVNCQFDFQSSKEEFNKFAANFETFHSFLIRVCPNLNNLHITIRDIYIASSIEVFTENFYSTIKAMEAGIKLINIGNEHLQISIELLANFYPFDYDKLPLRSHDLFKLGSPFTEDYKRARYLARSLKCVDSLNRIHELQFKIFELDYDR